MAWPARRALKYGSELKWWNRELETKIVPWYRGEIPKLWGRELPAEEERITSGRDEIENAVLTLRWADRTRYADLLQLPPRTTGFRRALDLGCGPLVPATWLQAEEVFGVEPIIEQFRQLGFPVDLYGAVLIAGRAEEMWMLPDDYFDLVVSHNAMDHMESVALVAEEIARVATPDATIRLTICYREPTPTEPLRIRDEDVLLAFGDMGLERMAERGPDEALDVLWGRG